MTIGGFTGMTPEDPFVTHPLNSMKFTTSDNDNDRSSGNCGSNGGWWHNNCYHINPNLQPPHVYLDSKNYNILSVEMKMRQHDCISQ